MVEPLYPAPATIDPPAATDRDLEAKVPVASLRMVPDPSPEAAEASGSAINWSQTSGVRLSYDSKTPIGLANLSGSGVAQVTFSPLWVSQLHASPHQAESSFSS